MTAFHAAPSSRRAGLDTGYEITTSTAPLGAVTHTGLPAVQIGSALRCMGRVLPRRRLDDGPRYFPGVVNATVFLRPTFSRIPGVMVVGVEPTQHDRDRVSSATTGMTLWRIPFWL